MMTLSKATKLSALSTILTAVFYLFIACYGAFNTALPTQGWAKNTQPIILRLG